MQLLYIHSKDKYHLYNMVKSQLSEANSFRSLTTLYFSSAALTHISNIFNMQKTVIRANLPTVALIKGEESPMLFRHSLLMKSVTPLGKL